MARPKGSTNKPKTARPQPTKVVGKEEDIAKVNKMLSSFESQSLSEEIKIPVEEEEIELSLKSLNDVLKQMKETINKKLTPEEKIKCLEDEVMRLRGAIEKYKTVIDYLETKLGIDE